MRGRQARRSSRPPRRLAPGIEGLDQRELPASMGVGPSLGSYLAPATALPKPVGPVVTVSPQKSVDQFLNGQLGTGLDKVQQQAEHKGATQNNLVAGKVYSEAFINKILSRQDTYTLLNQAVAATGGTLSGVYSATGPIISNALLTGTTRPGPNSPRGIPGLRLISAFGHNHNFPGMQTKALLNAFQVAVDRRVFTLSTRQATMVTDGLAQFQARVTAMNQAGVFNPVVPAPAPTLPIGPLKGTLGVSLGAVRGLTNVDAGLTGLPLPGVGNFPGRIDVGYVVDAVGNFGIALTARGPLSGVPKGVASADVIAGDIRVEVSNAPNLSALNGRSSVEGITQGSALSGSIQASNVATGVSTFSASTGYGSGLEFGTGTAYTQVIPLGNVYALIPEFPKNK